jgi:putative DNA primase/helicase
MRKRSTAKVKRGSKNKQKTLKSKAVKGKTAEHKTPVTPAVKGVVATPYPHTDLGNAQRLVARHGQNIRYSMDTRTWLCWDEQRWAVDGTGNIHRLAKETVLSMRDEARSLSDDSWREELRRHCRSSQAAYRLEAICIVARTEKEVVAKSTDFDRDPFLFNCQNGTVDLRTGELRPHRRGDLLTRISPVEFSASARAPVFEKFLDRITEKQSRHPERRSTASVQAVCNLQ